LKAVVMHRRGGPEVLVYEDLPDPVPGPGEALVRVRAATVNHTDLFHRSGRFFIQKGLPHVLGMDVAGEIDSLGPGAAGWSAGDRVVATFEALGRERNGAYAELTTVPVERLHRIPEGLGFTAAASIGLAFTTAWVALVDNARIGEGERVVVHAASSGVGTSAIQIARWNGARVVAIGDAGKAARLAELGASVVVDRRAKSLVAAVLDATDGAGATLVVDLVGRETLQSSIAMLARRGRIVCVGTLSGDEAGINVMDLIMKNGAILGSFDAIRREAFDEILRLFAEGVFRPVIDSVLGLNAAREAHEKVEARGVFGKIVLVP
jgi:NADPH:quinone reductase-like Zn-dependent oxidoreductase